MASKSSRTTTTRTTTTRTARAHQDSGISSPTMMNRHRSLSPSSPHHISRVQEKEDLQNLNDRLASYIERVNRLEQDNAALQHTVSSFQERRSHEESQIKTLYDSEISELRRALDDVSKDRARLAIEAGKHSTEAANATNKLSKLERQLKQTESRLKQFEDENADLKAKNERIMFDVGRKTDEVVSSKTALNDLERQLSTAKRELENEVMLRVDLGNQVNTLKEDAQFKAQVHQKQMDEFWYERRTEIEQVDERIKGEYDNKLVVELDRIRMETEAKIDEMRKEVEICYQRRLAESEESSRRQGSNVSAIKEDLQNARRRITDLSDERQSLQNRFGELETRIRSLENELNQRQQRFDDQLAIRDAELSELRKQYDSLSDDYQALLDVKISLDREIAAYASLIESGEARLQVKLRSRTQEVPIITSDGPGTKRRRVTTTTTSVSSQKTDSINQNLDGFACDEMSKGPIQITDEDNVHGHFVKITNTGSEDITIGGYSLVRTVKSDSASGTSTVQFEFPALTHLVSQRSIGIVSCDVIPRPEEFRLANDKWPVGDHVATSLKNRNGLVIASRESNRIRSGPITRSRCRLFPSCPAQK